MLRRVALGRTDVSEELSASFIRVARIGELTGATRRNIPEDTIHMNYDCRPRKITCGPKRITGDNIKTDLSEIRDFKTLKSRAKLLGLVNLALNFGCQNWQ
jgi:hypothetical protein